tara:strand:- start:1520 stop:2716 length:1197 start_codon:yes stop_codon:yes gene_type:complete
MTQIDVVGGVYGERCAFPEWNQIFGSAGRAAAALSDHVDTVRLHTVLPSDDRADRILANLDAFGIQTFSHPGDQLIGFDYIHCLADPAISPSPDAIARRSPFEVEADIAVSFGMMECVPKVRAGMCVYDPQSPTSPVGFRHTGGEAERLVIVANAHEIEKLSGLRGEVAAKAVLESENAELVVVKNGLSGAIVIGRKGVLGEVPAYKAHSVFTIGSGDVFVAAFAYAWAIERSEPVDAARYASNAVASYIETRALPMISPEDADAHVRDPVILNKGRIYLAGPFRELGQRILINEARSIMRQMGMEVFSPVHDVGRGPAEKVVRLDLEGLETCDAVFAILNGSSPGTLFEIGYAVREKTPVFCVAQNVRDVDMKLPVGAGCTIHQDFISALHLLAWRV